MTDYQTRYDQNKHWYTITINTHSRFARQLKPATMRMSWGQLLFTFYQLPVAGLQRYIHTADTLTITWETLNPDKLIPNTVKETFHHFGGD